GASNVPFNVPGGNYRVTFSFNTANNTAGVTMTNLQPTPQPDKNVEWDGLRHDSRDPLYRTPGGAVPAGTPVKLRLRTFHNDVTSVRVRLFDVDGAGERVLP